MIPVRPDDRCELCGANLALVGRVHRCVPRAAAVVPTPAKPKPALVGSPQRGTGRMPSRSIGSLTIVPTSATTCASAEQMPSLPPTWLAALHVLEHGLSLGGPRARVLIVECGVAIRSDTGPAWSCCRRSDSGRHARAAQGSSMATKP